LSLRSIDAPAPSRRLPARIRPTPLAVSTAFEPDWTFNCPVSSSLPATLSVPVLFRFVSPAIVLPAPTVRVPGLLSDAAVTVIMSPLIAWMVPLLVLRELTFQVPPLALAVIVLLLRMLPPWFEERFRLFPL